MHVCMRVHTHTHPDNSNTAGRQPGPRGSLQASSWGCEKGVRAHVQTEPGSAEGHSSPGPCGNKGAAACALAPPWALHTGAVVEGGGRSTEHRGCRPCRGGRCNGRWVGAGGRGATEGTDYRFRGVLSLWPHNEKLPPTPVNKPWAERTPFQVLTWEERQGGIRRCSNRKPRMKTLAASQLARHTVRHNSETKPLCCWVHLALRRKDGKIEFGMPALPWVFPSRPAHSLGFARHLPPCARVQQGEDQVPLFNKSYLSASGKLLVNFKYWGIS